MEWAAEEKSPLPIRGGVQAKAKQLLDEAAEEKAWKAENCLKDFSKTFKKLLWLTLPAAANTQMATRWWKSHTITAKALVAQHTAFPGNTKNLTEAK